MRLAYSVIFCSFLIWMPMMSSLAQESDEAASASGMKLNALSVKGFLALDALFDENPPDKHDRVWGMFNTNFLGVSFERRFFETPWMLRGDYTYGMIKKNVMNLSQVLPVTTDFDGTTNKVEVTGLRRMYEKEKTYFDLGVGYLYSWGTKEFYDRRLNGAILSGYEGNYGRYKIKYHGPKAGVRGRYVYGWFGLDASYFYAPYLKNAVTVTALPDETSTGTQQEMELGVAILFSDSLELVSCYRANHIHFKEPGDRTTMDLDIKYAGPTFELTYKY